MKNSHTGTRSRSLEAAAAIAALEQLALRYGALFCGLGAAAQKSLRYLAAQEIEACVVSITHDPTRDRLLGLIDRLADRVPNFHVERPALPESGDINNQMREAAFGLARLALRIASKFIDASADKPAGFRSLLAALPLTRGENPTDLLAHIEQDIRQAARSPDQRIRIGAAYQPGQKSRK